MLIMSGLIGRKRRKTLGSEALHSRLQLGDSGEDALGDGLREWMTAVRLGGLEVFGFELWVLGDDGVEEVEDDAAHNLSSEVAEFNGLGVGGVLEDLADASVDTRVALVKLTENIFSGL